MTKEQQEEYNKIVATGRLNEEQLARLRAGYEKAPQEIDIEKSKLHFDKAMECIRLEKIDPSINIHWTAENDDGDAYIFVIIPNNYVFSGKAKSVFLDAASAADTVSYTYVGKDEDAPDKAIITLGFMGIIQDPNKPDNLTGN